MILAEIQLELLRAAIKGIADGCRDKEPGIAKLLDVALAVTATAKPETPKGETHVA